MPTWRDNAIVLRKRTLRDADRHFVLFTEKHGKVVLLAKGSRGGKSKMAPHMSSFGVVEVMAAQGRLIDRLAGASLARPWAGIFASLPKMAVAQSFLLAVDALTKRDLPDERIFHLIAEFLEALDSAPDHQTGERTAIFDAGLLKLLALLGHALELDACTRCRRPAAPRGNALNLIAGGLECPLCRDPAAMSLSLPVIEALRLLRVRSLAETAITDHSAVRAELLLISDLALAVQAEMRLPAMKYLRSMTRS